MSPLGLNMLRIRPQNCFNVLRRCVSPQRSFHVSDTRNKAVKLKISHCSLWKDFQDKTRDLVQILEKEFPGRLDVSIEPTSDKSDDFEVYVEQELIHSKRWGDGFADRNCKVLNIKNAIKHKLGG